ncbi:MAG: hypothetical protein SGCHY_004938 [Lobulomycetales sp.]
MGNDPSNQTSAIVAGSVPSSASAPLFMPPLAREFGQKHHGFEISYSPARLSVDRVVPTRVHLQYGPDTVPEGYIVQNWLGFLSLVIPKEEAEFHDYFRQKQVMNTAMEQGCFLRIDTRVVFREGHGIDFSIVDTKRGLPVVRDKRDVMDLTWISPHFTKWDDVMQLQTDGEWALRWDWRICDVDFLLQGRKSKAHLLAAQQDK